MLRIVFYIVIAAVVHLNAFSQEDTSFDEMPGNTSPSEETMNEIENSTNPTPNLRAKPPGDGPAIGEIIVPIRGLDYGIIAGLTVTCLIYGVVKRQRKLKSRNK